MNDNNEILVKIVNNSYTQRCSISFNGVSLSEYSSLRKYIDEPFHYWCDKILDKIYDECNNKNFILNFISRQEELNIMYVLANNYSFCKNITCSQTEINTPLQKRLYNLNEFIRNNNISIDIIKRQCLFVIDKEYLHIKESLLNLNVKNSFCLFESNVIFSDQLNRNNHSSDIVFYITSSTSSNKDFIARYTYILNLDNNIKDTGFQNKENNIYFYTCNEENLFTTIFECLLLNPLLDVFRECLHFLPNSFYKNPYISQLTSIFYKITPELESDIITLDRSVRIKFHSHSPVNINDLVFSYNKPDIIHCNGMIIEGLHIGEVSMYIRRRDELDPFAKLKLTVIKTNKITSLSFRDDEIIVGEGDTYPVGINFYPKDADNQDKIIFKSDNTSIAQIDQDGQLHANSIGSCTILCIAEQISSRCLCIVKPYLQKIEPEFTEIDLVHNKDPFILKAYTFPEDCIDDYLIFSSLDVRIVNTIRNKIIPREIGTTKVIIQNQGKNIRAEVIVNVMNEKEYIKKQKKLQKKLKNPSEKKGGFNSFFKKILGR